MRVTNNPALSNFWHSGKDLAMCVAFIGALIVTGWVVTSQLTHLDEAQSAIDSAATLDRELVLLRPDWAHRQAEFEKAMAGRTNGLLLGGFEQLVRWLTAFQRRSDELGLDLTYNVGKAGSPPQPLEEITLIPIEVKVQPQNPQQAYQHFLQLVRDISEDPVRTDIDQVSLSGKGDGVKTMSIRLKLWMKEKT